MSEPTPGGNVVDRRMALAREWDDLVEQVRELEGFEDFLMPPEVETLLPAADRGPVVIVNVSRWRCDGLIVRPDGVTAQTVGEADAGRGHRSGEHVPRCPAGGGAADVGRLEAQTPRPGEGPAARPRRRLQADLAVERRTSGSTGCC